MATQTTRHVAVRIERPLAESYDFLKDPANFALWASGLGEGFTPIEGTLWRAATPLGAMRIRFSAENAFGVLDHTLIPDEGPEMYNPMRVVANGTGCEVTFTVHRRPDMSAADLDRDAAWVAKDLARLKALLEDRG